MKVEWHQNLLGNLWIIQMMRGSKNRKESVYIQMTKNHNWFWINQKKFCLITRSHKKIEQCLQNSGGR